MTSNERGTELLNPSLQSVFIHVLSLCLKHCVFLLFLCAQYFPAASSLSFSSTEDSEPVCKWQLMEVPKPTCLPGPFFKVQTGISGGCCQLPMATQNERKQPSSLIEVTVSPWWPGPTCLCSFCSYRLESVCHASHWWWPCYRLQSVHTKCVNYYIIFTWE